MKHLIYSNDIFRAYGDAAFSEAKAMLEADDEPASDNDVWAYLAGQIDLDAELFWDELKRVNEDNCWLAVGTIGTWHGLHHGGRVFTGLLAAIQSMAEDVDYLTIEEDHHGNATLSCVHHDGTNRYTLYRLSDHGREWYYRNVLFLDRRSLCETLSKPHNRRAARLREAFERVSSSNEPSVQRRTS